MPWDFSTEPEWEEQLEWMRNFLRTEILPLETLHLDHETFFRAIRPLQQQVKDRGLWAAHLDPEHGGQGYGQVKLALMHEILGMSELGPPVFGNQAPDSGNAELLALAATDEQKDEWLAPLLAGEILSAFSMTEQGTGSDPKQFTTAAVRDGDEWVINGSKWFVSNGDRAAFHILMAVTDPSVHPYEGQSMIIVPTDKAGIEMRPIGVMNDPDHKGPLHDHCEVHYRDVRVPYSNLLGDEGGAFVLAQKRLGPGRIHHCMRWIGVAQRAFDDMCERSVSMSVHGSRLADKQFVQDFIALSAADLSASRLLTLHAAWKIDQVGASETRQEIAMIKYHGAKVMHDILDRAIQVYGSLGFSTDMPLAEMYAYARAARLYDGPDEVHKATVAKIVTRRYEPVEIPTDHVPTRRVAAMEKYANLFDVVSAQ
ncbi:MAG: acyl-CoA dehydrogenase family protein [Solirubrobacterales bacterium]|nr:acyl-CoA dehydrogenase family protein [Solirubrobacterales bacterium]